MPTSTQIRRPWPSWPADYPIEWGILFSPSRQGQGRYPPIAWIERIFVLQLDLDLAAHICGGHARDLLERGVTELDELLRQRYGRVQINTSMSNPDLDQLGRWADSVGAEPILQCREEFPPTDKVMWLFDASGGRGIEPKNWPCAARFVGYAGGLSPGNVVQHLERISLVASEFWLDMKSGVRDDNDRFDLGKCRAVCEAVYG